MNRQYIPILTCGFVRSKTAAYVRAPFSTEAPVRLRSKGLAELPWSADRAVRRKGATVRKTGILLVQLKEEKRGDEE